MALSQADGVRVKEKREALVKRGPLAWDKASIAAGSACIVNSDTNAKHRSNANMVNMIRKGFESCYTPRPLIRKVGYLRDSGFSYVYIGFCRFYWFFIGFLRDSRSPFLIKEGGGE